MQRFRAWGDVSMTDDHAGAETLAAYIDGNLSAVESRALEEHLANCRECRHELVISSKLATAPKPVVELRRIPAWIAGIAAAAIVVAVPLVRTLDDGAPMSSVERSSPDQRAIRVIAPTSERPLSIESVRFIWNDAGDAAYRIRVTDSAGAPIWSTETRDTMISPASALRVERGRTYYWSIDALRADGSSYTSGSIPFTAR